MEERLQKILAAAGVASRREAEKIITAGRVRVNGKVVTELGCKFDASKVRISVDGKPIAQEAKAYYMFYKPRGVVTTMSDPQNRRSIADFVQNLPERVFPVGRLDFNTEGLLLLTNDGALAQALMHPSHEVNKTYLVKVPGIVPQEKLDHEGRNRQIRRMCDAIGFPVRDLKRIKLGPLQLSNLGRGKFRSLSEQELSQLRKAAKL